LLPISPQGEAMRNIVFFIPSPVLVVTLIVFSFLAGPLVAQQNLEFQQLPKEVRDLAIEVRASCKEADPDRKFDDMQGIQILSLSGDRSRDIVVDNEELCGAHMAGFNCSNHGCDLTIFKETSRGLWRKIFEDHLHSKYLAIDWETMRLQLMIVSIYAGDPRCQPDPKKEYTSGKSCNLIVTYRNNNWNWERIR
jgi:hypothetical protein